MNGSYVAIVCHVLSMTRGFVVLGVSSFCLLLAGHAWSAPAAQYALVPLGRVVCRALDRADETVAICVTGGAHDAVLVRRGAVPIPLSVLPGGVFTVPVGMQGGRVVGSAGVGAFSLHGHAFVGDASGLLDLDSAMPERAFSTANCRTPAGAIGGAGDSADGTIVHPLLWRQAGQPPQTLRTLGGAAGSVAACSAAGYAGTSETAPRTQPDRSAPTHATFWPSDTLEPHDIQTLEARNSWSRGINASGEIVGVIGTQAFRWTPAAGMRLLPPLPGDNASEATDVNDAGEVVGRSWRTGVSGIAPVRQAPVIWGHDGVPVDLSARVAALAGWTLERAMAIGPQGTILVTGQQRGQDGSVVLVPVPAPPQGKQADKPRQASPRTRPPRGK
jgi:hypothetical protein